MKVKYPFNLILILVVLAALIASLTPSASKTETTNCIDVTCMLHQLIDNAGNGNEEVTLLEELTVPTGSYALVADNPTENK